MEKEKQLVIGIVRTKEVLEYCKDKKYIPKLKKVILLLYMM